MVCLCESVLRWKPTENWKEVEKVADTERLIIIS